MTDQTVDSILASAFGWKATIRGPEDCWPWNASVDSSGIGRLRVGGRNYSAAKYAYELAYGPLSAGERLGHLCGDSGCVNHNHMALRSSREMQEVRFWARVEKSEHCWEWTGPEHQTGYAEIFINGRRVLVHRLSYEWSYGEIPDDMQVDHICWNRRCVRPDHLRLATPAENQHNKSGANKRSTTGVRGVTLRPNGRYQARITEGPRSVQVGHFATLEEAAEAVDKARREMWGEFAGHG